MVQDSNPMKPQLSSGGDADCMQRAHPRHLPAVPACWAAPLKHEEGKKQQFSPEQESATAESVQI